MFECVYLTNAICSVSGEGGEQRGGSREGGQPRWRRRAGRGRYGGTEGKKEIRGESEEKRKEGNQEIITKKGGSVTEIDERKGGEKRGIRGEEGGQGVETWRQDTTKSPSFHQPVTGRTTAFLCRLISSFYPPPFFCGWRCHFGPPSRRRLSPRKSTGIPLGLEKVPDSGGAAWTWNSHVLLPRIHFCFCAA